MSRRDARPRKPSVADFAAAAAPLTPEQRAGHAICRAVYGGADCSCELRRNGSVCEAMRRAAVAARGVFNSDGVVS